MDQTTGIYASEKERGLGVEFDRIRRITGYLVGGLNTWNSSKRAEERDRVTHVKASNDSVNVVGITMFSTNMKKA